MASRGSRLRLAVSVLILCAGWNPAFAQTIHYVDNDAPPGGDGLSWGTALQTVQAGLDAASAGDEVWVAANTYVERITLRSGVELYGGFDGTELFRSQRDVAAHETIIDGYRGIVVTAPSGATPTTRIDGFTIRNGEAYASDGAGVRCYNSSPTINNNIIRDGGAGDHGGGIYCHSSSAVITRNVFINNGGSDFGGAIYCTQSSPLIAGNTMRSNRSGDHGAGICCVSGSSPLIMGNLILGNVATGVGGGIYCHQSSPNIVSNVIAGNQSASNGGGIYCSESTPILVNNTITRNEAFDDGGGIYCNAASPLIVNTIIAFNSSGVFNEGSGTPTLRNNCIYANSAYVVSGLADPIGIDGNFATDPMIAGAAFGSLHIQPDSPCVNAGDNDVIQGGWVDGDGQPRIQDEVVDVGADESDGTVWTDTPSHIVRVSTSGDDASDGSCWERAKRTVQDGIDAAGAVSVEGGEVWVAAGVYMERITLQGYAYVYGGFAGTETSLDDRDPLANETIIDGHNGRVVSAVDLGLQPCTIDGFTLRNGEAYASNGAGVYCYRSAPRVSNNVITRNGAGDDGGGIYAHDSSPVIVHNTITRNGADNNGCGISCRGGAPTICSNIITGNSVNDRGAGIYLFRSEATICNNVIVGNRCGGQGGGVYCEDCHPLMVGNTIMSNTANAGAGLYLRDASPVVANTIIAFNSSGIYHDGAGTALMRSACVFGNASYDHYGMDDPTGSEGNISSDPIVLRLPYIGADNVWATDDDNYGDVRLMWESPCIDAGSNQEVPPDAVDLDVDGDIMERLPLDVAGTTRFVDDPDTADTGTPDLPDYPVIVDMGAYEYDPFGDYDEDGAVNEWHCRAFWRVSARFHLAAR